ncbi:hypothetical protein SLE2022_354920 [Rubroshorea leprosula]
MPKVRTNRTKYPDGWELIEPTLRDLDAKMREGKVGNLVYFISFSTDAIYHGLACPLYIFVSFLLYLAAENDPHDGKRKCEALWPIFKISHEKSRYIFDLYYKTNEISTELYEFCLYQGYGDRNLIAKWKKSGYERLCCLRCIQPRDHNFGTTCVCRVPKHLMEEKVVECVHCGCRGCASGD